MEHQRHLVLILIASAFFCSFNVHGEDASSSQAVLLETLSVEGVKENKGEGYRVTESSSATRTDTPLLETPQSIQVISQEVLADQVVTSFSEALNNVSGAQGSTPLQTPAFESTILRGFPAEYYRDGITNYINTGDANAMSGVERIEVLKGPNAILYGGGVGTPLGGVVNIVSKKPEEEDFTTFAIKLGSNGYLEPSFDINKVLSDGVLFRTNASYVQSYSDVDVIETDRYSFSPSMIIGHHSDTRLTIDAYISKWQQQEYQGLPATGTVTGDFKIDRDLYIGDPDIPDSSTSTRKLTFKLEQDFNNNWSNTTQFRYGENEVEQITQIIFSNTPDAGDSSWYLYNSYVPGEQREYALNSSFEGNIMTGSVLHTLLIGGDYSRIEDYSVMYMDYAGIIDLDNPDNWPSWTMPSSLLMGEGNGYYTTTGVFIQTQSSVDKWHVLGGLRLAHLETIYDSEGYSRKDTLAETRLLPRLGVVYEITDRLGVFANYSEGMKANAFTFYSEAPEPEYSDQFELGVKFDTGTLSGSLAAFYIQRENVPVTDPDDATYLTSITEGMQRSQGVEVDLVWQLVEGWSLIANYAFTDAVLTEDIPNGAEAGSKLAGVPSHSGSLWVNYDMTQANGNGWRFGGGINTASSSFVDQANLYKTDGYWVANTSASYKYNDTKLTLAIKNIMGKDYDLAFYGYLDGRVAPATGRQFFINVTHSL
ncbi:MAG: TonB-dependent siderophore receptor [Marinomonas sp.]